LIIGGHRAAMGDLGHDPAMKSRVHPKYKTKYRVGNWAEYDRALAQRGDITLWISADATKTWKPAPSGKRGGQRKFSDHAIEAALILRLVFKLPLRQAEGFLRSVLSLMDVDLEAPDHTTLSRRSQHLDVALNLAPVNEPIHLIVDSTGLSIVGEGEWAAVKHGGRGRRGWKKLHLGVDRSGVIVAEALTDGNSDDAKTALDLIDSIEHDIASVMGDAAYDTIAIYAASAARDAKAVVPPAKSSTRSRRRRSSSSARDRTIMRVKEIGRRQWKKESGYHRQARVENTFFRYKTIIGPRLRARHPKSQKAEAIIACNILNRMTALGRPESLKIGA
jgi:IS5 family transposase